MTDMQMETPVKRGPGRPPLNRGETRPALDDNEARLAKRVEEIRGTMIEVPGGAADKFHVPAESIPDGWTYEWKRWTTFNKTDPQYFQSVLKGGWQPVPSSRHPELTYDGYEGETIVVEGMILCERPKVITDEARAREHREAMAPVRAKEAQMAGKSAADITAMGTPTQATAFSRKVRPTTIDDFGA